MTDSLLGCYTVEKAIAPAVLFFDDLPRIYKDNYEKEIAPSAKPTSAPNVVPAKGKNYSALFDLKMSDLVTQTNPREPHPLHGSEKTGANFSLSPGGEIAHCWRCDVTLNAIQYLAIKSGEYSCRDAGTPHKGASKTLEPKMIFYAWRQAKLDGILADEDPIPSKAITYIAQHHKLAPDYVLNSGEMLPREIYLKAIEIVEEEY